MILFEESHHTGLSGNTPFYRIELHRVDYDPLDVHFHLLKYVAGSWEEGDDLAYGQEIMEKMIDSEAIRAAVAKADVLHKLVEEAAADQLADNILAEERADEFDPGRAYSQWFNR